jgi:concentrative nucleoside transporter, CNT family
MEGSVMSIPASLVVSKMRMPETEKPVTEGKVVLPESEISQKVNALHAFSDGAWTGLLVAGTIVTNLLCIIALVALIDALLGWAGSFFQVPQLSIVFLAGYILWPVAALLGVPGEDITRVAQLLGIKVVQNEFVAYISLSSDPQYTSMSSRAQLIATYALCGFGNIGSLGIQIGVLGQLGPGRKRAFAEVAVSALLTGVLATLMSASIAGMVLIDESSLIPSAASNSTGT